MLLSGPNHPVGQVGQCLEAHGPKGPTNFMIEKNELTFFVHERRKGLIK
jgi:hypothetical protein